MATKYYLVCLDCYKQNKESTVFFFNERMPNGFTKEEVKDFMDKHSCCNDKGLSISIISEHHFIMEDINDQEMKRRTVSPSWKCNSCGGNKITRCEKCGRTEWV